MGSRCEIRRRACFIFARTPFRPRQRAGGRTDCFVFYFEDADTGLAMIIPGIRGQGDVARFHLTGGLTDPQKN
jgi:hypothetical protein